MEMKREKNDEDINRISSEAALLSTGRPAVQLTGRSQLNMCRGLAVVTPVLLFLALTAN